MIDARRWCPRPREIRNARQIAADLGFKVTIGIVAKERHGECMIAVSDMRISFDGVPSMDGAVRKQMFLGDHWGVLFAANDTAFCKPIVDRANGILTERGKSEGLGDVQRAMCDAYAEIRREHITRKFLGPYGIASVDQFRQEGASGLGRKLFWSLSRKIDSEPLGQTTFLVFGYEHFKGEAFPQMFEVQNPGVSYVVSHLPYYAIGSGAPIAMASLGLREIAHLDVNSLMYRVLEAKFWAETSDTSVGKSTTAITIKNNGPSTWVLGGTVMEMRKLWERSRYDPAPQGIHKLLEVQPPVFGELDTPVQESKEG